MRSNTWPLRLVVGVRSAAELPATRHGDHYDNDLVLDRVDATGDVRVSTPKDFARGNSGIYYAGRELATLEGDVRITSGENQLNGGYAEVNLKTGVSRMLGGPPGSGERVRGLLIPQEKPEQN